MPEDAPPRYSKLGYVALNVTDLERSRRFYEAVWGLEFVETGSRGELFFRCGDDHHNVALHESAAPGLKRIGWEMESQNDLDALCARLAAAGIPVNEVGAAECAQLHQSRTIRFTDPFTGATHEAYAEMRNCGGRPYAPTVAKIMRVGHVVLWSSAYTEAVAFYEGVLNFRSSDTVEGLVTFMRCFPSPFHHSVGLARRPRNGLHHVNFMVTEIDDIGRALSRLKENDVPVVFGPGRHPPSGSVFLYALDPDGLTVEYSFGMEEFPEINPRKPRLLEPIPQSLDFWNSRRDPRYGTVGDIEVFVPTAVPQPA